MRRGGRCFGLKMCRVKIPPPNIPGWKWDQGMSVIFKEVKKAMPKLEKCKKHGGLGGFVWWLQVAEEEEGRKISHLVPRLPRLGAGAFPIPSCSMRAKPCRKGWQGVKKTG